MCQDNIYQSLTSSASIYMNSLQLVCKKAGVSTQTLTEIVSEADTDTLSKIYCIMMDISDGHILVGSELPGVKDFITDTMLPTYEYLIDRKNKYSFAPL